jgi:hypothetical protein
VSDTRQQHHLKDSIAPLETTGVGGFGGLRALKTVATNTPAEQDAYPTRGSDMPLLAFVTVENMFIRVLEIQDSSTSDSHYNFSMTVYLDTYDIEFVDINSLSIATQIFDLYSMARPNPIQHVTWLQPNFQEPTDLPFPTDTVMVVHWEAAHPFSITEAGEDALPIWHGPDPEGIVVVYDNIEHTTTFTLPKNHPNNIFYYCWNHEAM